jgi:HTH-type transcriptional regulator, cell division transcriptional repressor
MKGEFIEDIDGVASDYSDDTSTFGDRLTHAREALGLDQAQLAHRLGIKHQTLRNWEEDRSEPRANKLQMLAGMLNVSIVWLMSGQGEAPSQGAVNDGAAEDCLIELRRLRAEQIQIVEKMARLEKRLRAVVG